MNYSDDAAMENHSRRMAPGDPRPARTPLSREQRSSFFRVFLRLEAVVQHVTYYATDFCRVGRRVVYPSWGTCQITRGDGAIIDIYLYGVFWFDCSFFTACPRVVTLTALQTQARSSVLTITVRFVRFRQPNFFFFFILRRMRKNKASPTAVVCSCELQAQPL